MPRQHDPTAEVAVGHRRCPPELLEAAGRLRSLPLALVLAVVGHPVDTPVQRVYTADADRPAHEIVVNHNSSDHLRSRPHHGIIAEVSLPPGRSHPGPDLEQSVVRSLADMGLVKDPGEVRRTRVIVVADGYPVPAHDRHRIVGSIRAWLADRGIFTVSRFAEWAYINADEALGAAWPWAGRASYTEKPGHPGNVFWRQSELTDGVLDLFDGRRRARAVVDRLPHEADMGFRVDRDGLAVAEMAGDQRDELRKVLEAPLDPFRSEDRRRVLACLDAQGRLDGCHLAFYREGRLSEAGAWDNWRLGGPALARYYRGAPHAHVWVNVADTPSVPFNARIRDVVEPMAEPQPADIGRGADGRRPRGSSPSPRSRMRSTSSSPSSATRWPTPTTSWSPTAAAPTARSRSSGRSSTRACR